MRHTFERFDAATEAALFRRFLEGDKGAGQRLLLSVYDLIHRTAIKHARQRNSLPRAYCVDRKDLAGDYVVHFLERLGKFNPARGRLTTFASACLRTRHWRLTERDTECKSTRAAAERGSGALDFALDDAPEPAETVMQQERIAKVRRTLRRCSPEQRRLLRERFWGGKKPAKIAAESGLSRQLVCQRLQKAIALVAARLAG
jgi:RNA polymerase sigma factor (sigma-70 family)